MADFCFAYNSAWVDPIDPNFFLNDLAFSSLQHHVKTVFLKSSAAELQEDKVKEVKVANFQDIFVTIFIFGLAFALILNILILSVSSRINCDLSDAPKQKFQKN